LVHENGNNGRMQGDDLIRRIVADRVERVRRR